jgi:uncharacterized membrane protein YfcA
MDDILGFGLPGLFFRLLSGAIIGFSIGLTGVGGGVLILPTLTILFGMDTTVAVGTASLYSFITRVTGTFHHYKLKTIKLAVAIWFLVGAIPANVAASWFVAATVRRLGAGSEAVENFQSNLNTFVAIIILLSCVLLVVNLIRDMRKSKAARGEMSAMATRINGHPLLTKVVAAVLGIGGGALMGATSVGGGVLIIPMLIIFFGMTSIQTVGTSFLITLILTLITSVIFLTQGQVDYGTGISMAIAAMLTVPIGTKLSVNMPERVLKFIVVSVIIVAVGWMLIKNGGH